MKSPHMTKDEFETFERLQRVADNLYDGHLTVCKFTTDWRVGFGTPTSREDIKNMYSAPTFFEAAWAAISDHPLGSDVGGRDAPQGLPGAGQPPSP